MKQMLLIRKDLKNMGKGKTIAQAAHASMKIVVENYDDPRVKEWLAGKFTKIAVWVESEEQLKEIVSSARDAGLLADIIVDAGLTVFEGIPTVTCGAIGPDTHDQLAPFTGGLRLI